jgi:LysR family transcriptional regulator, low CO2-responsive transcriptional regulator
MPIDDRITLNKLKVFALVVDLGSVTQAADRLYVAQPVVTAHIRSLEERVGTKLFYREGRSMHLTEAGRTVHGWASDILTRTRELERNLDGLTDGTRGSVVVGASMTIGSYSLPPILVDFGRERPQVQIRMNILDPDHVIPETESGENDFAVVLVRVDPSSPGLVAEQIGVEELVLVAAATGDPPGLEISADELRDLRFVEAQARTLRRRHSDAAFKRLGLNARRVAIELGHPEAMKHAVMSGLGVSLMYRSSVAAELEAGTLREVQIDEAGWMGSPVFLVYRKDRIFSAAQLDLINSIRLRFAAVPSVPSAAR